MWDGWLPPVIGWSHWFRASTTVSIRGGTTALLYQRNEIERLFPA